MSRVLLMLKPVMLLTGGLNRSLQCLPAFSMGQCKFLTNLAIPPPPKKPKTPYIQYLLERKNNITKENPGLKLTELVKIIASEWNELDKEKREVYEKLYAKDHHEYLELKKSYLSSLTSEQRQEMKVQRIKKKDRRIRIKMNAKLRQLNMPKYPGTPLSIYISEKNLKAKGMKPGEFFKLVTEEWNKLNDEQRKVYSQKALEERVTWEKKFKNWKKHLDKNTCQDVLDYLKMKNIGVTKDTGKSVSANTRKKSSSME